MEYRWLLLWLLPNRSCQEFYVRRFNLLWIDMETGGMHEQGGQSNNSQEIGSGQDENSEEFWQENAA